MPESYLWLLNHGGNTFALSTRQRKFQQLQNSDAVTVKRLSSSSWCAWGLGHDHRVYIYVFSSDVPIRVADTLYENQRWMPFRGFSASGLIFTDRYPWSDATGVKDTPKESFRLPSAHWAWDGDWMVDENLRGEVVGIEGWQYATDFPSTHYVPEKHWQSCVRKRKWIRFRRFTSTDSWTRISDMEVADKAECFIDVSIGGFALPSQAPGFLSVWAVTNNGNVYVRANVCQDKPEGDSWQEISLGSNLGVINICVGASNLVWAITWDGRALVRTGINRKDVYGKQWEVVECPDESIRFMQVAVGRNVVWALSREGKVYFRKGTCGDDIHGNVSSLLGSMWVQMVGEMSHIAVSANDQVFAIDMNSTSAYFRSGVTSSDLTGKTWQPISLHEDVSIFQLDHSSCASENDHDKGKHRASSFTTSCSSSSTQTFNDDTMGDVFQSPQSLELMTANLEISKNSEDGDIFHDPIKKEQASQCVPQASSDQENTLVSDYYKTETESVSKSSVFNIKNDEEMGKGSSTNFNTTVDNHSELSAEGGKTNSNPQDKTLPGNSIPFDTSQTCSMAQNSADTNVLHFVEELTEVDRFLVEREILQTMAPNQTAADNSCSIMSRNVCDNQSGNPVVNSVQIKIDSTGDIPKEQNKDEKEEGATGGIKELHDFKVNSSPTSADVNKTKDDVVQSKIVKKKHKTHPSRRNDFLSVEDDPSDSIVYHAHKGRKKKRRKSHSDQEGTVSEQSDNRSPSPRPPKGQTGMAGDTQNATSGDKKGEDLKHNGAVQEDSSVIPSSDPKRQEAIDSVAMDSHQETSSITFTCYDNDNQIQVTNSSRQSPDLFTQDKSKSLIEHSQQSSRDLSLHTTSPDCSQQMLSLHIEPTPERRGQRDLFLADTRRCSLDPDSPVSDGIIDFVSFIDVDDDAGTEKSDKTICDSLRNTSQDVVSLGAVDSVDAKNHPFEERDFERQYSLCSEIPSPELKLSDQSFEVGLLSSSSSNPTPEIAQLIPLRPARKIFRYQNSPSPCLAYGQEHRAVTPVTFSQSRYNWRWLDVSALHVDDPAAVSWLSVKKKDLDEGRQRSVTSFVFRNVILEKLKERNWREGHQFMNFEQAVQKTTWVKKAVMQIFIKHSRWYRCNVELEQSKVPHGDKCLSIVYMQKKRQKVKQVVLKDLTCVTSSANPELRNCFNIFTTESVHTPTLLQATSEAEAREWISLLYGANARRCNLDRRVSAGSLWSCTKLGDVLVSSSINTAETKPDEFFWGHHGGHMSLVETGACGITWGIGFDRMPYIYNGGHGGAVCTDVPGMSKNLQEMTDFDRVYVYENQIHYPVVGWCSKGVLSDNFHWITGSGQSVASKDEVKLPSSKWQWISGWTLDFNTPGGVNSEGWQFSTSLGGSYHSSQNIRDVYRRRCWVRMCRLNTHGPWQSAGSLSLLDVSIQVDPVTSPHDAVVVWAVGANGDVLCRYGVTKDNPLGHSWVHIATDLDMPFVGISVGGGWRVWGVASDGSTWYRSEVTQYLPVGKSWLQVVEPPSGNGILRQVSAGTTAVWAVDTEDNLWRRRNITKTYPEGTDWEFVATRVKRVSVGPRNQVWIVADARFNYSHERAGVIYRRIGITEDRPGGSKWERVIGDGWSHVCVRGLKDEEGAEESSL